MEITIVRQNILSTSHQLIGIPYKWGAKWLDLSKLPNELDCSGMTDGVYFKNGIEIHQRDLDGAQAQFEATVPVLVKDAVPTDLAFFGRNSDPKQIYHVGMLYDNDSIIEARGFDGRDWTGKVTLRGRSYWEAFNFFMGYRRVKAFIQKEATNV